MASTSKPKAQEFFFDKKSERPWEHESNDNEARIVALQRLMGIVVTKLLATEHPDYKKALKEAEVKDPVFRKFPATKENLQLLREELDKLRYGGKATSASPRYL